MSFLLLAVFMPRYHPTPPSLSIQHRSWTVLPVVPVGATVVVTASDSAHFQHLVRLLQSLEKLSPPPSIYLWDVGLRACQLAHLRGTGKRLLNLTVVEFPYWEYPLEFRARHFFCLAPLFLQHTKALLDQGHPPPSTLMWMDARFVLSDAGLTSSHVAFSNSQLTSCLVQDDTQTNGLYPCWVKVDVMSQLVWHALYEWARCAADISTCSECYGKEVLHQSTETPQMNITILSHQHEAIYTDVPSCRDSRSKGCIVISSYNQSGSCLEPLAAFLHNNRQKYAEVHGYRLIVEDETFDRRSQGKQCNRVWGKIDGFLKHMDDCELLLWVDADTIITNFSLSLEYFIQSYANQQVSVNHVRKDVLFVQRASNWILNAGVILIRNSQNARNFFLQVYSSKYWSNDWCTKWALENAAMNDVVNAIPDNKSPVLVVNNNDHALQSMCGFPYFKLCYWKPGDFLVHFAPPLCPLNEMEAFIWQYKLASL